MTDRTASGSRAALILYGTETGNSQDVAEDLDRQLQRLHFTTMLDEMDSVLLSSLLQYTFVVFVVSTTGQGDMPRNSRIFWKSLLRKKLSPTSLSQLRFTTFGLGDSTYTQFNWAARKLRKRLCQLGAHEFHESGEADEQHPDGVDGTLVPWIAGLRLHLLSLYPLPPSLRPTPDHILLPPRYPVQLAPQGDMDLHLNGQSHQPTHLNGDQVTVNLHPATAYHVSHPHAAMKRQAEYAAATGDDPALAEAYLAPGLQDASIDYSDLVKDLPEKHNLTEPQSFTGPVPPEDRIPIPDAFLAKVLVNERMTPQNHWQDIRRLQLVIFPRSRPVQPLRNHGLEPGRTIRLYPKNYPEDVQTLINLMGWGDYADTPVRFSSDSGIGDNATLLGPPKGVHPVEQATLRDLLLHNLDITAVPKRSFFELIWHWTDDPTHKERLQEFCDPALKDEFFDYTSRPRRTILEVLQEFTSVKIPLEYVATVFPAIRGRDYSIAMWNVVENHLACVVDLVVAMVKFKTVLRKTRQGLTSRYIEPLRPLAPLNVTIGGTAWHVPFRRPVLAICTGTGVAPIHYLVQERHMSVTSNDEIGKMVLFYGCRTSTADYLYSAEMLEFGVELIPALSREPGQPRKYVQQAIVEHAPLVRSMICDHRAQIIICGSAGQMPKAVKEALAEALVDARSGYADIEHARDVIARQDIIEECW